MKHLFSHEHEWVMRELDAVEAKLKELGEAFGEAMEQSSETWHDNAPLDAVKDEAGVLWQKRSWLLEQVAKPIAAYPDQIEVASTGHMVTVQLGAEELLLFLGNIQMAMPSNTEVVTYEAPLHQALLGKTVGEDYELNAKKGRVTSISSYKDN